MAVRENQNISLTCKAEGFPEPRIKWKREDQQPIIMDRRNKSEQSSFQGEITFLGSKLKSSKYCILKKKIENLIFLLF